MKPTTTENASSNLLKWRMQTISAPTPPVNYINPIRKALLELTKSKRWFVAYFIMMRPSLTFDSTIMCIKKVHRNRAVKHSMLLVKKSMTSLLRISLKMIDISIN